MDIFGQLVGGGSGTKRKCDGSDAKVGEEKRSKKEREPSKVKGTLILKRCEDFLVSDQIKEELKFINVDFINYSKSLTEFLPEDEVVKWMCELKEGEDGYYESVRKHTEKLKNAKQQHGWIKGEFALSMLKTVLKIDVEDKRKEFGQLFMPELNYERDLPLLPTPCQELNEIPVWEKINCIESDNLSTELRVKMRTEKNINRGVIISGQMGAGKTKGVINFITDNVLIHKKNAVYVSPRILLAKQFATRVIENLNRKCKKGSETRNRVKVKEINFQMSMCYKGAIDDIQDITENNEKAKEITRFFDYRSWFHSSEKMQEGIPSISIVVVNSLHNHIRENKDVFPHIGIFDEIAVINGNFGMKVSSDARELGTNEVINIAPEMEFGIEWILDRAQTSIFIDAGFSQNQVDSCKRMMGFSVQNSSRQNQLILQKRLRETDAKGNELNERQCKRRINHRAEHGAVLATRYNEDCDEDLPPKDIRMITPIFVCNDPKFDAIFKKIVIVDDKDTFLSLMIDSVNRGNCIATAYSKTKTMAHAIENIQANTQGKFVVPLCKQILKTTKETTDQIESGKKANVFAYTQKLGVGFSLEDKNAFDEVYMHVECDMYAPSSPDMVQLIARIRSVTTSTLYVHIAATEVTKLVMPPISFCTPPLLNAKSGLYAASHLHAWNSKMKIVLGKTRSAAVFDYVTRLVRGFLIVKKDAEKKLVYELPELVYNNEVLTKESSKVMKKNHKMLKDERSGYPDCRHKTYFFSKQGSKIKRKIDESRMGGMSEATYMAYAGIPTHSRTGVFPKIVPVKPEESQHDVTWKSVKEPQKRDSQNKFMTRTEHATLNDRHDEFASWCVKLPTFPEFKPVYVSKETIEDKVEKKEETKEEEEMKGEEEVCDEVPMEKEEVSHEAPMEKEEEVSHEAPMDCEEYDSA